MLFKINDRSFKFFLWDLCDTEYVEITNLITENGGEVSSEGHPPAIIFANSESYVGNEPVFHINYIHECVRHGQLLDLINFKIGAHGYYGCVMSIFVYGENMCSFVEDTGSCCSSIRTEQSKKSSPPINDSHIHAQGDVTVAETSNADSEFLSDRVPSYPGLPPDRARRDLECLPTRAPSNLEFVPAGTLPDLELLAAGSPRGPELVAAGTLPDSEFLLDESPPNPRLLSDKASQNSELSPAGSPQDSEVLSGGSPPDSQFFPEESQSSITAVVFDSTEQRLLRVRNINFKLEIPEPASFEEFGPWISETEPCDQNTCEADQSASDDITFHGISPATSSDDIIIVHVQLGDRKDAKLIAESALPCSNINESYSLSAAEKEAVASKDLPVSVEQDDEMSLNDRLEQLKTSEPKTLDRAISPVFEAKKIKRKSPLQKARYNELPVAGGSGIAASPTILRDKSNQVKILGGIKESLSNLERFRLTSSDSDDTDYGSTRKIVNHEKRTSVDQNSSFRIQETDGKKKQLKKRRPIQSPLRESDIPEDDEEPKVLNNDKKTVSQSQRKRKSDDNLRILNARVDIPTVSNTQRNTVVSSIRLSDDVASTSNTSNSDSDPLSDDGVASHSSRKTARSAIFPKKLQDPDVRRRKFKHLRGRQAYQPWEQRAMVKYLIDNKGIADARGYRVWQQMKKDGLTDRTEYSLNNHFRKTILPNIDRFQMSKENRAEFEKLLN